MRLAAPGTNSVPRKSALPPYFVWRDGRPRWEPGPAMRRAGHKGRDLKAPDGGWMSKGAAIDAAERINDAIRNCLPLETPQAERTLGALFDKFEASQSFLGLKPRTQADYRQEMKILRAWSGDVPVGAIKRGDIKDFQAKLIAGKSLTRSNAIMRVLRLTMNYAADELDWIEKNRASKLKMKRAPGRLVMWTPEEIVTFVLAADWMGLPSQGDAVIMGLCMGQSRADILAAPPLVLEGGVYRMQRRKTGITCYIPPTKPLTDRLAMARARNAKAFPDVTFSTELVASARAGSYPPDGDFFAHEHLAVRKVASGLAFAEEDEADHAAGRPVRLRNLPFTPMPSLMEKSFQDLRDTAVTMLYAATKDIGRVANITGHSLKTAQDIIDKHYFVRNAELAIDAGLSFDALLATTKIGA